MRLYRQPRVGEWVREHIGRGSQSYFRRVERVTDSTAFLIGVDLVSAEFVAAVEAHKTAINAWRARRPADAAGVEVSHDEHVYVSLHARLAAIDTLDATLRAAADQISAIRAWLAEKPVAPTEAQYPLPNGGE